MKLSYSWRETLGSGGYGLVFAAKVISSSSDALTNTVVALKKARVSNHVRHPMLLHEACAMLHLRGHESIPEVFAWGRSQYFEYLAMEHLGQNLREVVNDLGLTQRNLVVLICQMMDAIEYVHQNKIIHCDIKTNNFVFGQGAAAGRLHLIDFGLCRPWSDRDEGKRLQMGTVSYCSERVLRGHAPARRDDMEALAYTIAELLTGSIPWEKDTWSDEDSYMPPTRVDSKSLCGSYPAVFADFVDYTRALGFVETPQYGRWRAAFRELAPGLPESPLFDKDDDSLPRVGVKNGPDLTLEKKKDLIVIQHDSEELERRVYGADSRSGVVRFMPLMGSSWGEPTALSQSDVLGDELKIVTSALELIEERPEYNRGITADAQCAQEVMNNTQSDTHCIPY